MRDGESDSRRGIVLFAPCDSVIRRDPLRTRQPDLFIFLHGREDVGALEDLLEQPVIEVAPGITIAILSGDETHRARAAKIDGYRRYEAICW